MNYYLKHILYSIFAAIVVLIVCYAFDNIPYPFGSKTGFFTFKESIARKVNKSLPDYDSATKALKRLK